MPKTPNKLEAARLLSPLRNSSKATSVSDLVSEQLKHFNINPNTTIGKSLSSLTEKLYLSQADATDLWSITIKELTKMDRKNRIAYFNAKRFLCFQLAKILDTLLSPMRKSYQSLVTQPSTHSTKGPYPLFDNVPAIFSATPVVTRTATYLYACTEWIDDAFQGKEMMLEIYSRLLNPTSISLANHIVDIAVGKDCTDYFAWNFNSGMAAIDSLLSHLVGYNDIILSSRNVYGGTHQLLTNWYGKSSNLDIAIEWFDGYDSQAFLDSLKTCKKKHQDRLQKGRKIYTYLESPCNPHGYVLDVPNISKIAHKHGLTVICDATIGTPFLKPVLKREDPAERPDFVIHSYTKDLVGTGTTTAGVVIGRNEHMFIPKNETLKKRDLDGNIISHSWKNTLFWNVYYVKGAFLDSEKAFEVLTGMRTLELRMLKKCTNTLVLAKVLNDHPNINVHCSALASDKNHKISISQLYIGLPAPLFTIDFEKSGISNKVFKQFFDSLEPAFGLQVSLGQMNTVILCPALTSHSELSKQALKKAEITPTTIRISVGDEDPRTLLNHFIQMTELVIDPIKKGFSKEFMESEEIDELYKEIYLKVHRKHIEALPSMELLGR